MPPALTTAVITALIGGIGWIAAYLLTGLRDDRTKRLQLTIEHASNQIREFYAPLVALTDQLDSTFYVKVAAIEGKSPGEEYELSGLIYHEFFLPIHEEINQILKTKVHLLEGADTPQSFNDYFKHYATEKAYWTLIRMGKDVSNMQVPGYPPDFYDDVRKGYGVVSSRYESSLQELRHRRWLS